MRQCAFLTMDNLVEQGFMCYDSLTYAPLKELGWLVTAVPWRQQQVNWSEYELVVIRSPWDYQDDPKAFFNCLKAIENSKAVLQNPLKVVQWNIDKHYLRDLAQKGIKIVPSLFGNTPTTKDITAYFKHFKTNELVIKPTISANADDTFRLPANLNITAQQNILQVFNQRDYIVQPFIPSVVTVGEFSVFMFGGQYSHSILKTPKTKDFRVQEEHGGIITSINASKELLKAANQVFKHIDKLLYARADFVQMPDNSFALMELELIEPSLYFTMHPQAANNFAQALNTMM